MTSPARTAWDQLTRDPRLAENAPLRASDQDRDVALRAVGEAFADGRLDRAELDERTTRISAARCLGDLVDPLVDLAADAPVPVRATQEQSTAVAEPGRSLALPDGWVLLVPVLVCWAVWLFTCFGPDGFDPYFPWPVFVSLGLLGKVAGSGPWGGRVRCRGQGRLRRPGW